MRSDPTRAYDLAVTPEVLAAVAMEAGDAAWKPVDGQQLSELCKPYALMATSADKGTTGCDTIQRRNNSGIT